MSGWIAAETGGWSLAKNLRKSPSCTTVERYRKSTVGLPTARRSQRGKCSASRSGGDTGFLHLGQATVGRPTRLLALTMVRSFFTTR